MTALLTRSQRLVMACGLVLTVVSGLTQLAGAPEVARFGVAGVALAALAAVVGVAIDQVGGRLGPGATGLVQSALGNLPELFVGVFALRQGLTAVVQATIVGSVLSNTLLVLGVAFLTGGLRHGAQRFPPEAPRMIATLLVLAVAALVVPTLAFRLQTPAAAHAGALSNICAGLLLAVYLASIPFWLRGGPARQPVATGASRLPASSGAARLPASTRPAPADRPASDAGTARPWPLGLAVVVLAAGSGLAAVASDWFVAALEPAIRSLGISQSFTGLVIVAIAANAAENVVGVRFALKGRPDYAISTVLNSPLQIALLLTPILVLVSRVVGPIQLTLVFPPLLVVALALAAVVVAIIVYDGEYTWLEGVALIALYGIVAAAFWWG
ncbi:MAG: sodium:proton exchanger [Acidimicrobiales bacterium]